MKHKETFFQDYSYLPRFKEHWVVQYWNTEGSLLSQEFETLEEAEDFEDFLNEISDVQQV